MDAGCESEENYVFLELMEDNIYKDSTGSDSDKFRWLEAFDLHKAYKFMLDWSETSENIEVSYYQYVIAFLLYVKYQDITYQVVREHLTQCQKLATKSIWEKCSYV